MADSLPQSQTLGTDPLDVAITLPSLTGTGTSMMNLILSGTDRGTGAATATGTADRVVAFTIYSHTGSYHFGAGANTGTMSVTVVTGQFLTIPAVNTHRTFLYKSSVASTMTVTAICILK